MSTRSLRRRAALLAAGLACGIFAGSVVAQQAPPAGRTEITNAGKSWPHEIKNDAGTPMTTLLKEIINACTMKYAAASAADKPTIMQIIGAASDCLAYDGFGGQTDAHNCEYQVPNPDPNQPPTTVAPHNGARMKVLAAHSQAKSPAPNWATCLSELNHGH